MHWRALQNRGQPVDRDYSDALNDYVPQENGIRSLQDSGNAEPT